MPEDPDGHPRHIKEHRQLKVPYLMKVRGICGEPRERI
jgi:hypothetical protein